MSAIISSFGGWLGRASWQAAVLTLIVMAAQWVFREQLNPRWRHALWFLVLARLAMPFAPSSPVSVYNYVGINNSTRIHLMTSQAVPSTAPAQVPGIKSPAQTGAAAGWRWMEKALAILAVIWSVGALFFAARFLGQSLLFHRRLGALSGAGDAQTLAILERCKTQMGVTAQIRLMETGLVKSPALYGLFQKTLLLPTGMTGRFSAGELRHVFLHELAHVKRRDMEVLWLVTACKVAHWFNPVLWYGFGRMEADRELACDELALCRAGERESGPYGETILKLLEWCARPVAVPGLMGILEENGQMRRRISMIAEFKRRRGWSAFAGALLLAVGLVTLTDAQTERLGDAGGLPSGLVASWSGAGNGKDSMGGNTGVLKNVSLTDGVTGQAFLFAPDNFPYGTYTGVQIPDQPAYALTNSLSIVGWIRPRGNGYVIFFRGDHRPGLDPYCLSLDGHLNLTFEVCAEDGNSASVRVPVGIGAWIHVAGVLDGDTGKMNLYTNGVLAAQITTTVRPFGALQADQFPGIGIGNVNDGGNNFPFVGEIDGMALYDRALSADEVKAIYAEHAANAGGLAEPLPTRNNQMPAGIRSEFQIINSN